MNPGTTTYESNYWRSAQLDAENSWASSLFPRPGLAVDVELSLVDQASLAWKKQKKIPKAVHVFPGRPEILKKKQAP